MISNNSSTFLSPPKKHPFLASWITLLHSQIEDENDEGAVADTGAMMLGIKLSRETQGPDYQGQH